MALVQRLIVLGILIAWGPLANATVGDTAKNRSALAAERGMGALGQSTAAAGMAEAFGLRLYQIGSETGLKWGEFGWQTVLPLGPLSFQFSSDWIDSAGYRKRSDAFGFSLRLGQSSSFGISRRSLPAEVESWTASYYTEFDRWLTMALMADGFNAPKVEGTKALRKVSRRLGH